MDKVVASAAEAVADIASGSSLAVGGFGLCGIPRVLIEALLEQGVDRPRGGVEQLRRRRLGPRAAAASTTRIRRMVSSYVGENKEFARQYLHGELEVELTPQGTLAERMRAGGSGIPAFFTATGVGTQVAEGGLPWRYDDDGQRRPWPRPAKEVRELRDRRGRRRSSCSSDAIVADFGLVRAWKGDRHGNLVFRQSARNFNPLARWAGGSRSPRSSSWWSRASWTPDDVHTPGVFVQRVVPLTAEQAADKRIEKRTVRTGRPRSELMALDP